MGLIPDKPNPPIRSFAQPDPITGTRRCTKCLVRKDDNGFRWLQEGKRRSSRCKACEKAILRSANLHIEPDALENILGRRLS
jgi:hypothetical protein